MDVTVAPADDAVPMVASFGGILRAGNALDAEIEGDEGEAVVLTLDGPEGDHVGVAVLHRHHFVGAKLDRSSLQVQLGSLTLTIDAAAP